MEWKTQKLTDIASAFEDGDWIESKDQSPKGILLVQTGNVGVILYKDKETKRFVSEETFKRLNCTEIFTGDILISRLPDPIGRACIIPKMPYRMITAVDCTIFRPKEGYDTRYLNYLLNSEHSKTQVYQMITGSSRKRISRKNLGRIELPIPFKNNKPDLAEQKHIANKLDKVFAETEKCLTIVTKENAQTVLLKQSLLEKIFSNPEWENKTVSDIQATLIKGVSFDKSDAVMTKKSGYTPLLRAHNIKEMNVNFDELMYVRAEVVKEEQLLKNGDIVFVTSSGSKHLVGKSAFISNPKEKITIGVFNSLLRFPKNIEPRYIFYALNSPLFKKYISGKLVGANINNIKKNDVLDFEVSLPFKNNKPDLAEQKHIAGELDKAFALSEQLRTLFVRQEKSFVGLRASVLNDAFKPEIQTVPVAVSITVTAPRMFDIQQAVALILKRFERGEMIVAKVLYLAQSIYRVPLGIKFSAQNFGPYDSAVKRAVTAGLSPRNKFFAKKGSGGMQVLSLGANANKILKYSNSALAKEMNYYLNETMPYFSVSNSSAIERLATICKIIEDTKTANEKTIKEKLHEWKPNKFQDAEVSRTIAFIKKNKWDVQLVK